MRCLEELSIEDESSKYEKLVNIELLGHPEFSNNTMVKGIIRRLIMLHEIDKQKVKEDLKNERQKQTAARIEAARKEGIAEITIQNLREKLAKAGAKVTVLENTLVVLDYVVILERKYFPLWLLQCDVISRYWKWMIAMSFELTLEILVVLKRAEAITPKPNIDDLANTITKIYGEGSAPVHSYVESLDHLKQDDWNMVFNNLGILLDENEMAQFLVMVKSVTSKDKSDVKEASNYNNSRSTESEDYVFNIQFKENRQIDETTIENISSPYSLKLMGTVFIKDKTGEPTNRVFVFLKGLTDKIRDDIELKFKDHEFVNTVVYKVAVDED